MVDADKLKEAIKAAREEDRYQRTKYGVAALVVILLLLSLVMPALLLAFVPIVLIMALGAFGIGRVSAFLLAVIIGVPAGAAGGACLMIGSRQSPSEASTAVMAVAGIFGLVVFVFTTRGVFNKVCAIHDRWHARQAAAQAGGEPS